MGASHRINLSIGDKSFQLFAESPTNAFWMLDDTYRFIHISPGFTKLYGCSPDEVLGTHIEDRTAPESLPMLRQAISRREQSIESGINSNLHYRLEFKQIRKDGSEFWIETNTIPCLSSDGRFMGVIGVSHDITAQKEAELASARRVELELLANELSSGFLAMPSARIDDELVRALGAMGAAINASHGHIFLLREGTSICENTHKWHDPGVAPLQESLKRLEMKIICPHLWDTISREESHHVSSADTLPESLPDKRFLTSNNISSILIEPLVLQGSVIGFIGFNTTHLPRTWSEEEIDVLRLFSKNIALVIERQRMEHALSENRQELLENQTKVSLAISMANMGVWESDLNACIFTFNDQFYSLLATTAEDEGGYTLPYERYIADFIHPEDIYLFDLEYERITNSSHMDNQGSLEHRIIRRDGQVRHLKVRYQLIRDSTGQPVKNIGVNQDITEEKQNALELQKSQERFATALDSVNEGVWEYWMQTGEIYFNAVCYTMLGYDPGELPQRLESAVNLIHSEDYPLLKQEFLRHALQGTLLDMEVRMRTRSGEWRWINTRGRVVERDDSGRPIRFIGTNQDITERIQAKEKLIAAKQAAEAANMAKSQFLANMSHEIRTPLNGILGMLQLLDKCRLDAKASRYAALAFDSGCRLAKLLGDILDLSNVESGETQLGKVPFTVQDVVDTVIQLHAPAAGQAQLSLLGSVDKDIPPVIGDPDRLQQALGNLVDNAIKFTDTGHVRLEAMLLSPDVHETCRIYFQVSDTGIGIPDNRLDELFTPFTQVDGGYTRQYEGAGLGLSITRKLLSLMGGSMSVSSEPGKGTEIGIAITLPARDRGSPACPPDSSTHRPLNILLAEDEKVNQLTFKHLAEAMGHSVTVTSNGREALAAITCDAFDLVVMDIQMPVFNGIDATRAIRDGKAGEENRNVPILALTALAMTGDRERMLNEGMDGYLSKPFDMAMLRDALDHICNQPR